MTINFSTLRLEQLERDFPAHSPRPQGAPLALEGIRVADFSHFLAGPFATMILADMGAEVIKIESPGRGDEYRHYPPIHPEMPGQGSLFLWGNRNKRSVGLDLKNEAALAVARDLIANADVLVENFSTGVMHRFGLDYAAVRKINPRIVYCSISGYGRDGEFKDRGLFDAVAQAESGLISMTGFPDREGVRTLSPVVDISTATMAANAILGALVARGRTGRGQFVEAALFDTAVMLLGPTAMQHLFTEENPQRVGNGSHDSCPTGVFQSRDRPFSIICGNDRIALRLLKDVLGRADLADDPGLATREGRIARRDELLQAVGEEFIQRPWSYWEPRMRSAAIPCAEVRAMGDALRSPETRSRQLVSRLAHPVAGWLPNVSLPIRLSGTPLKDPQVAPGVGEHTIQVLTEVLGYDAERIESLRRSGALG